MVIQQVLLAIFSDFQLHKIREEDEYLTFDIDWKGVSGMVSRNGE